MGAHAGRLDHAPERFLTPFAACLVGVQHQPELLGLVRERVALLGEQLELLLHFAQGGRLRRAVLLQVFLIGLQLLLERFDKRFDGFLSLREVAFGRFLKLAEGLFREAQEFRGGLLERIGTQRLERGA